LPFRRSLQNGLLNETPKNARVSLIGDFERNEDFAAVKGLQRQLRMASFGTGRHKACAHQGMEAIALTVTSVTRSDGKLAPFHHPLASD
jgi:hypothetical protein